MYQIKIIGAGSIGNHLTHAARSFGWKVTVTDKDPEALVRMRTSIYPSRYGKWDESIQLIETSLVPSGGFDLIFVGTPPDTHLPLALAAIQEKPRAVFIEKPVCTPDLALAEEVIREAEKHGVKLFVGYDHVVGQATKVIEQLLSENRIGKVLSLDVEFREHWDGILRAHPWLSGVEKSYLGYWKRGGGAGGEHSHGLNYFQHLAYVCGLGRVTEVSATIQYQREKGCDYDCNFLVALQTENGVVGRVAQDSLTNPPRKRARIFGSLGTLEWVCNFSAEGDAILLNRPGQKEEIFSIKKTRPDDFKQELHFLEAVLQNKTQSQALDLSRGLDTMLVLAAAHRSAREKRTMSIDYQRGYRLQSIRVAA